MPRNSADHGGLSWREVRAIAEAAFDWLGTLAVYEEFVPSESAKAVLSSDDQPAARTSSADAVSDPPRGWRTDERRTKAASAGGSEGGGEMANINFYSVSGAYGCFSNFSPHPIVLKGKTWPTSEPYFQAQKFAGTPDEEEVRRAKSPLIAARMGRSRKRP